MRRLSPSLLGAGLVALAAVAAGCASESRADTARPAAPATPDPTTSSTRPVTTTTTTPTTTTTAPTTTTTTAAVDVFALRPPAPAAGPGALAAQIATAEAAIRDPQSTEAELAAAALAQQVAYRQLGRHPEWDAAVITALPAALQPAALQNAAARREFAAMHTRLSPTLPAWRIIPPEPAEDLRALYEEAEVTFGIPWKYLAAVHLVETGTGRIRGTSSAGAQGPMQFMPATWAVYGAGGDINDTRDAIMGAARYLAANNGTTDIDNALFHYNRSNRYVRGVRLYADLIAEHPRAFLGYHHWGIWYLSDQGDVYLPVGYEQAEPIPVADYRSP